MSVISRPARAGAYALLQDVNNKSMTKSKKSRTKPTGTSALRYPKHSIVKALRIPKAIIDQNAGKECTEKEAATFVSVGYGGPFQVEISSALKYGVLERVSPKVIKPTTLALKILRPQKPEDKIEGLRTAVLNAPTIQEVYMHYRGENLPDKEFFENALLDKFNVPGDKISEFIEVFTESLDEAQLLDKKDDKVRVLDVAAGSANLGTTPDLKKIVKNSGVTSEDKCFVMMPFSHPIGGYYSLIYEEAIKKAGLTPIRADSEIFGTGKIVDQIWSGINAARVLVAELTSRNPNVFYELGLAHALGKPVVLVSSNESDVPFDLTHVRVIYYDVNDPFWGQKLIEKVAENILSAINNPDEVVLFKKS